MIVPCRREAYQLFHEGQQALAQVEANGIRVDVDYLEKTTAKVKEKATEIENRLFETDIWADWKKRFRGKADLGSPDQLAAVLYERYEPTAFTATGKPSTDEAALLATGDPFVETYLKLRKLRKMESTYLKGILTESWDGYLHPMFGLSVAVTYRSNCERPNFQNMPIRDPKLGKMIRRAFIPRDGCVFLEIDFSAIEVRVAACYHKDPTMLEYLKTGYDLHKDMAAECFALNPEQVPKDYRREAKGRFVFAEFYGDWWKSVGKALWGCTAELSLLPCVACGGSGKSSKGGVCYPCEGKGGCSAREHLAKQGYGSEDAYIEHIKRVEDRFWNVRFPVYTSWKKDWLKQYYKNGFFETLTGFCYQGLYVKNEVINYAVQGAAFHCLLWSLIQVVKEFRRKKLEAKVIGQIHDSLILDVPKSELKEVLSLASEIMTERLREHWPWLIVPIEIEAEGSDKNWFEKEEIPIG